MGSVCFTHPLELVKIRMQKSGEMGQVRQYRTSFHAVYYAVKNEGILALYNGYEVTKSCVCNVQERPF